MAAVDTGDEQKKMTIVATQGSFDMAYPPLILASTAAAFGWDVVVFHTFWGSTSSTRRSRGTSS